jgi:hypothetical protein
MPSGNWSFTYARREYDPETYNSRVQQAAVAVMMRYPERSSTSPNDQIRNSTMADVSVMMVCAKFKVEEEEDGADGLEEDESSNDDDDMAMGVRPSMVILGLCFIFVFIF